MIDIAKLKSRLKSSLCSNELEAEICAALDLIECKHTRIMKLFAKSNDLNSVQIPHLNLDHSGYNPYVDNVCGGDDVSITLCLDCGKLVGFNSMTDKEIEKSFLEVF